MDSSPQPIRETAVAICETYQQLQKTSDWLRLLEDAFAISDDDSLSYGFSGGGGTLFDRRTAEEMCYLYPTATAAYFVNEPQFWRIVARSRAFVSQNQYWVGINEVLRRYVVGNGHIYNVKAKPGVDEAEVERRKPAILVRIQDFLKRNRYTERQKEKITRKLRDGGFDLRKFIHPRDNQAYVRFVEPRMLRNPPDKTSGQDDVWFGIEYAGGDYETPIAFYVARGNLQGQSHGDFDYVPASEMQHRTVNVDLSSPRGVPTTYHVQKHLERAARTLESMGRIVEVRAKIAALRKVLNGQMAQVRQLLGNVTTPTSGGQSAMPNFMGVEKLPTGAILTTSDQVEWSFPPQGVESDKIVMSIQADLRSVAAGTGLAEFMVSADASNSSYSSTMVAESVPVQTFQEYQQATIDEDLELIDWALRVDERFGLLDEGTMDMVDLTAEPPLVVSRNRLQERQADAILVQNKAMSVETMAARDGLDPVAEQQLIQQRLDAMAAYGLDDPLGDAEKDSNINTNQDDGEDGNNTDEPDNQES